MDVENNKPPALHEDDSKVTLSIRLIMQGKEVGSIIGKKGEIVKRFREESGAKINISDGTCPERIVTVTGNTNAIFKAFTLICKKFEEWCSQFSDSGVREGGGRVPITIRLIFPASQCGSLIGKGGSKIKEIRDITGANIQVASEMLPNSTERAVTITGSAEAITQTIYHICIIMLESPPRGTTIPYRPKAQVGGPVILAGGQAYTIQGNYAVPAQDGGGGAIMLGGGPLAGALPPAHALPPPHMLTAAMAPQMAPPGPLYHHHHLITGLAKSPLAGLAALGLGGLSPAAGAINPAVALAALAGSQLRTNTQNRNQGNSNQQSNEMTVPNELIGCIIGKGGTKIAEIRQISGAMIRISNCEEREGGATDRTITITGSLDSVALAQYLINMSVELQKANLEGGSSPGNSSTSNTSTNNPAGPLASAIPLAQLLTKPGALGALSSLTALGGLTDLLSGQTNTSNSSQAPSLHRKSYSQRRDNNSSPGDSSSGGKSSKDRNKFNPY